MLDVMHLPMKGNVSDVGGMVSDTTRRNTARDSRVVIHRDTFSPLSGGSKNDIIATVEITMHGNSKFNM